MITKKDAIAVGAAICDAARKVSDEKNDILRHTVRGTCITALDIVWFDVLPQKTREQFGWSRDAFYEECGWPE